MPPTWHFFVLVAAFLILGLSLFLFIESVSLQQFAFREIKGAPSGFSGILLVATTIPLVLLSVWFLELMQMENETGNHIPPEWLPSFAIYIALYVEPLESGSAIALASLVPTSVAIYKFLIVRMVMPKNAEEAPIRIGRSLVGICAGIVNFTASIATLVAFLFRA